MELTNKDIKPLKGYEFPSKCKSIKKLTKVNIGKALNNCMGWDWIHEKQTDKVCGISLSSHQYRKLNESYCVALSLNVADNSNPYYTICNSLEEFGNKPIRYGKVLSLPKEELVWLYKLFS